MTFAHRTARSDTSVAIQNHQRSQTQSIEGCKRNASRRPIGGPQARNLGRLTGALGGLRKLRFRVRSPRATELEAGSTAVKSLVPRIAERSELAKVEQAGGFSMVEVLLALAILGIGLSLGTSLLSRGQQIHSFSRVRLQEYVLAERLLVEMRLAETPRTADGKVEVEYGGFQHRARILQAALPEDLRLVEIEVAERSGRNAVRVRGVVPSRNLVGGVPPKAPSPVPSVPLRGRGADVQR